MYKYVFRLFGQYNAPSALFKPFLLLFERSNVRLMLRVWCLQYDVLIQPCERWLVQGLQIAPGLPFLQSKRPQYEHRLNMSCQSVPHCFFIRDYYALPIYVSLCGINKPRSATPAYRPSMCVKQLFFRPCARLLLPFFPWHCIHSVTLNTSQPVFTGCSTFRPTACPAFASGIFSCSICMLPTSC